MININKYKEKAKYFFDNDLKAFIKDSNDQMYFCKILPPLDHPRLYIYNFDGPKIGTNSEILWIDIELFTEYKEKGDIHK